jgi:retron-type reverse transcriptase
LKPPPAFTKSKESLASLLARCFLAGEPDLDAIVKRCTKALEHEWRWLRPLARKYLKTTAGHTRPREDVVAAFILSESTFKRAVAQHWLTEPQQMQPVPAAKKWQIPRIETARDLADWFWLEDGQLEWFADLESLACKTRNPKLRHYHYRILEKPSGGLRLIEAPKKRLKEMQRQILDHILDGIPDHPAVHGFVKGRSIKTFAAPHVGQQVVLRMDIKNFFPSFGCPRIQALFRTAGFPETVADLLGGMCTTATPKEVCARLDDETYSRRHLPQGAPTSPALANMGAFRMDCRLDGLAKTAGVQYTRYADDLAFSGDINFERFSLHAATIAEEEGFHIHHRKTRIMRQGVCQHLAGLVTNEKLNVSRAEFDQLKAILHNCVKRGPESQNREHLNGRISFVESVNPSRGAKLREIYARITWPLL